MFFKKKAIQPTNVPTQSEPTRPLSKRTNKKLASFLQERLPRLWCWEGYVEDLKNQYPKEYLIETLTDFLGLLTEPRCLNEKERAYFQQIYAYPELSQRQFCCASLVSKYCCEDIPRIDLAFHEFMDCIDNFGETYRKEREISPEEHLLYWTLTQMILITVKHTIV